jgi:hypothetical protein
MFPLLSILSYILKKKNYELCFFGGFLRQSNYKRKQLRPEKRYSCLAVGRNKSQITVCCLKRQTPTITGKNYNRKKSGKKGTVIWLLVGIHVKI